MKINLEIVRKTLRDALGYDAFVASFIKETRETTSLPTAGITKNGCLSWNPEFVSRYVTCKEDLFSLIMHELLHPMFGHFIFRGGEIENIAADAIINSAITHLYPLESRDGALFRRFYPPRGITGLLRPMSELGRSRYDRLYNNLYAPRWSNNNTEDRLSTGELIQTLRILTQDEKINTVVLLGDHSGATTGDNKGKETGALPEEVLARIAEDIKRSMKGRSSRRAGHFDQITTWVLEALRTHLSIRKAMLRQFTTQRKLDHFKEAFRDRRISVSPIPISPSKRDLVMLAAGAHPCYFHNQASRIAKKDRGLAIYLDVSGSVNDYLPKIIGVLQGLRREITSVFQFSNEVVEVPFESLLKGHIQTTYGTDFDCIAKSILERKFDKAVIITDGAATMQETLRDQLKQQGLRTLTILFDETDTCPEFEQFGDLVQLDDICESTGGVPCT